MQDVMREYLIGLDKDLVLPAILKVELQGLKPSWKRGYVFMMTLSRED
jgi:hypothetical protein